MTSHVQSEARTVAGHEVGTEGGVVQTGTFTVGIVCEERKLQTQATKTLVIKSADSQSFLPMLCSLQGPKLAGSHCSECWHSATLHSPTHPSLVQAYSIRQQMEGAGTKTKEEPFEEHHLVQSAV